MAFSGIFSIHVVCIFFIDVDDAPYALIPSHLLIECFIDRYLLIFILQTDKLDGIRFVVKPNAEAYDLEIPELNCVYTHMMGHDCHSIVAGCPHADGILSQLNYYLRKGFDLVLTSHYTPEDLKDVRTKIAYLTELKEIALDSESADEMRARVQAKYPHYSGQNYLDMTVGFFFPQK